MAEDFFKHAAIFFLRVIAASMGVTCVVLGLIIIFYQTMWFNLSVYAFSTFLFILGILISFKALTQEHLRHWKKIDWKKVKWAERSGPILTIGSVLSIPVVFILLILLLGWNTPSPYDYVYLSVDEADCRAGIVTIWIRNDGRDDSGSSMLYFDVETVIELDGIGPGETKEFMFEDLNTSIGYHDIRISNPRSTARGSVYCE